jgi:hypothetical protein
MGDSHDAQALRSNEVAPRGKQRTQDSAPDAAPIQTAQEMLRRGAEPEAIAAFINANRQFLGPILMFTQQTRGNAFTRKVADLAQIKEQDEGQEIEPGSTGSLYADDNAKCATPKRKEAGGCFLKDDVRSRLIVDLKSRVDRAYSAYLSAIAQLKIHEMIEKEDELGVFSTLLLNVVFTNVGAGIIGALKALKSVQRAKSFLEEFGEHADSEITRSMMKDVNEKQMEAIVGSSLDIGKEQAKGLMTKAAAGAGEDRKSAATSYLTLLEVQGATMYERLSEQPPAQMNDQELIAYNESFRGAYHSAPAYIEKIEKSLGQYLGSHAKEIGRTTVRGAMTYDRETRVAWVQAKDGSKQLMYVNRDFNADEFAGKDAKAYHGEQALSYSDKATAHSPGLGHVGGWDGIGGKDVQVQFQPMNGIDGFLGWVEPGLVDVAVMRHKATWQEEPKVYKYDFFAKQGIHE